MSEVVPALSARLWPEARGRVHNLTTVVLLGLIAGIGLHNVISYPPWAGFDSTEYLAYARGLVEDGTLGSDGAGYTPPGYFGIAGVGIKVFEALGSEDPDKAGQYVNLVLLIGTAALVLAIAATLLPTRPLAQNAALGFFGLVPVVQKIFAMFHPQPLVTFLSALALLLVTRMIVAGRYSGRSLAALAVTVAAAQLVRSAGVWTALVVVASLLAASACGRLPRRQTLKGLGVMAAGLALLAVPWWVYLQRTGGNALLGRGLSIWPDFSSWPLRFYVSFGWPDLLTHPTRFGLPPRFLPLLYSDTWGDYFGIWSWGATKGDLDGSANDRLLLQSLAGVAPSVVAVGGWVAVARLALGRLRDHAAWIPTLLFPPLALVGCLYYATKAPTPDGDTVKALFLLPAIPAVAVCFGFALDVLLRRGPVVRAVTALVTAACALACIEYTLW
jgi:hypothetical protein